MNDIELAWVAGLLEGEGSFTYRLRPGARSLNLSIQCLMTDSDVIYKLARITGVGTLSQRKPPKPGYKLGYCWQVRKRGEVIPLLCEIRPHMGQRRSDRIGELLKLHSEYPKLSSGPRVTRACGSTYDRGCRCAECKSMAKRHQQAWRNKRKLLDEA